MPYSGTTTFLMTRDDIIKAALRGLEIYGPADTVPAADITNCTEALNIILKAWGVQGLNLWTNTDKSLSLTSGTGSYDVGPSAVSLVANLPLRVTDAYVRVSGQDTKVQIISRYDYDVLPNKSAPGIPAQLFYDPTIPNGRLYLYPVPNAAGMTLHFISQEAIQDIGSSVNNPAVPQEWYQLLKWALMDEISCEYGCTQAKMTIAHDKAVLYRKELSEYILQTYGSLDTPSGGPRVGRA